MGELGDLQAIEPLYAELNKDSIPFMDVVRSLSNLSGIAVEAQLRDLLLSSDDLTRDKANKELKKILDSNDSLENNQQKINEPTKYDRTLFDM